MEYTYNNERPETVVVTRRLGQPVYTINIFVQESDISDYTYKYVSLTLPQNTWDRAVIISGIVRLKYTSDEMDAIRNNYDLVRDGTAGNKTQEYTEEYLAMQAWRREAKELASEIIEEYEASQLSE